MALFSLDLGQQLAQTFGDNNKEWKNLIIALVKALENGDSCLPITDSQQDLVSQQKWVSTDGSLPFVIEDNRLYMQRYWQHERVLIERLTAMSIYEQALTLDISQYFTDEHQQAAAELALTRQLAIITGGPGTGKTTTVVKILTLLLMQNPKLKIALAAPTGKAAMRLTESISKGKLDQEFVRSVFKNNLAELDAVPCDGKTLHRLLGVKPLTPEFRHCRERPLAADVVVVDEASMIDIGMMSRLLQALKPSAKLILMGDKDQLASVETGAVLAEISKGLPNNRVHLQNTYRFKGGIKDLALAVNNSEFELAKEVLANSDIAVMRYTGDSVHLAKKEYQSYFDVVKQADASQIAKENVFKAFDAFQVLCASRRDKMRFDNIGGHSEEWYLGRPIMILENHAELGLFNGDIGIALNNQSGELQVFFPVNNDFKAFLPSQLPEHETAFAMTIHKSQGSEFGHVLIVLPDLTGDSKDRIKDILTKELLYTAITRAKKKVSLSTSDIVLEDTIKRNVKRNSGLLDKLTINTTH